MVKIRLKMMGRKHRPFFRIVAIDGRQPRDGRVLEELGTYDPMMTNKEIRVTLKPERIKHWQGVGAEVSEKVATLQKRAAVTSAECHKAEYADCWDVYPFNSGYFMCLRLKGVEADAARHVG